MKNWITDTPKIAIQRQMEWDKYLEVPALNQSTLKSIDGARGGCPAMLKHSIEHPRKDTDATRLGRMYHEFLLDREQFDEKVMVLDQQTQDMLLKRAQDDHKSKAKEFSKRLKSYKEWSDSIADEHYTELSDFEYCQMIAMRNAIMADPKCAKIIEERSDKEVSVFGSIETSFGTLQTKGRFDMLGDNLVDLKTCAASDPDSFARSVFQFGYDIQSAFYLRLARQNGLKINGFGFLAQCSTAPYLPALYWMPSEWIEYADRRLIAMANNVARCIQNDSWPGYGESTLNPPAWIEREIAS